MEQHPVPQNVIEVEFKLFGSFTIKQFSKIVIGGLTGVGIFFLDFIPAIIRFPLVLIAISLGILMAIIPNLGVWLGGILKALFISPRYVWIRQPPSPTLLFEQDKPVKENDKNAAAMQTKKKIDITDLPLEKLFGTKRDDGAVENDDFDPLTLSNSASAKGANFERVYESVYGHDIPKRGKQPQQANNTPTAKTSTLAGAVVDPNVKQIEAGPNMLVNIPKISRLFGNEAEKVKPEPSVQKAEDHKLKSMEEYMEEIKFLKQELKKLSKGSDSEKENAIMSRINTLYNEVKLLQQDNTPVNAPTQSRIVGNRLIIEKQEATGKYIFGVVVDKKDGALSGVSIQFINLQTQKTYNAVSGIDGRFKTSESLPNGDYNVMLEGGRRKFHSYKIIVKDQELPAYKFREK